jgi:hypothetical protein
MRIVVDENLSPRFAKSMAALGFDAMHVNELELNGVDDHVWIPAVKARADVIFSADVRISQRRAEVDALIGSGLVLIVFPAGMDAADLMRRFLTCRTDIERAVAACSGGAAFCVRQRGAVVRLRLRG